MNATNQQKFCPKCRKPQQNEQHILCETCKEPYVSLDEGLRLLTKEEVAELSTAILKDWRIRFIRWILPFAALGGVFLAALFLNWQAGKRLRAATEVIEQTASNEVSRAYSTATNQLALQFQSFAQDANSQIATAYSSVTNQIAVEFQTPRVKQTVEAVAKGDAKEILEAEVEPAVKAFKEDSLFVRTVARAQGYDFKAYQSLLEIGNGTNENAQIANQVITEIDRSLARDRSDFSPKRTLMTYSGTNFYNGPFTSDELAVRFSMTAQDRTGFNREGFINTVSDSKQPLFLPLLIEFFTNETDLAVADRTTIAISDLAKEDFHPHDFEQIVTWWHSHQNDYTNWPITEFNTGFKNVAVGNYSLGFQSFQKILDIDPSADQSRALAILCGSEIGETNKVAELTKGFKQPDARWTQWAAAIVELQNGSVSNATVRFADLKKKQPGMIFLPDEQIPFWRNIDWQLFHKLTSPQ